MFTMTLRDALAIQAKQIEHYKFVRTDLAEYMATLTHVEGLDLDVERSIIEVNRLVPRGGDIEYACGLGDQGGA